jgi:hypothetical protein
MLGKFMNDFSLRGKGIKKERVTLRYEQNIPGYMRNYLNNKSKRKYAEATSGILGKILKITPLYITVLSAFHIFSWAFFVSSGNIGDISFILQKEGMSGGISRMFTLMVPHIMMLMMALMPSIVLMVLYILSVNFGIRIYRKIGITNKIKNFLYSCILGLLLFVLALCLVAILICTFLNSDSANNFSFDQSFDDWIKPENIIPQLIVMFILPVIPILFFLKYREDSHKVLFYRIILWVVIFSISVVPFSMFSGAYSKGYGTECISLDLEDSMIKVSEMNNAEGKEGKLKPSWVIQSGGKDVAEMLDKNKGKNTYVLASYVYSEDKDYLNIMVFSIRKLYKDNEGKTRVKSDLLINKNGEGKSGVLVSIKKSSIAGRYLSNPLCFKGES